MLIHSKSLRAAGVSLALLLLFAAHAAADTVRVLADRASIVSRADGTGVVLTQVSRNAELTVLRQVGDYYEVVLPGTRSGAAASPGSRTAVVTTGFIRVSQAVVWILTADGPMAKQIAAGSASAPARRSATPLFLHVDAGYRIGGDDLIRNTSAFSDLYAEPGSIAANYGNGSGPQIDLMGGLFFTSRVAIAGGVSFYNGTKDGRIDAEIPHPFYFGQPRSASFESNDLTAREIGIHISLLVSAWETPKQRLSIFGGPSFFNLSLKVPDTLSIDESYPYDEAAITGVTTSSESLSVAGFHVGGDFTRFLGANLGVGVAVRYSHGAIDHTDGVAHTTGAAGNTIVSGGVRFRF